MTNPPPPAPQAPDAVTALPAHEISRRIAAREMSCAEVMAAHLAQIARLNPAFNAVISLRDDDALMAEASDADAALARGDRRGWLHGMPIAIKDLAETAGLRTTYGSPLFADFIPDSDNLMVARIKSAGAIVIGKTNTPEFGYGSQSYNRVHGATGCAYDPTRTAGGSSGGAAAALALRMVPIADGSDMMGSLRNPGAFNNVYGLRPSWGRVPNAGAPELYMNQLATEGPMGRSVKDVALLLDTLSGPHPGAPLALPAPGESFAAGLDRDLKGLKIGWIGDWQGRYAMENGIEPLCREALRMFESLGCIVTDLTPDFDPERLWTSWLALRQFAIGGKFAPLLADPGKRAELKPEALWEAERGLAASALDIHRASADRSDWHRCLIGLFEDFDALALPSAQAFPFDIDTHWPSEIAGRKMDTYHRWMEVVIPGSLSACPSINIPVGFNAAGLPMGMQLIAPPRNDRLALQFAAGHEAATRWSDRLPPILGGPS